jgi:hypothetical protein
MVYFENISSKFDKALPQTQLISIFVLSFPIFPINEFLLVSTIKESLQAIIPTSSPKAPSIG